MAGLARHSLWQVYRRHVTKPMFFKSIGTVKAVMYKGMHVWCPFKTNVLLAMNSVRRGWIMHTLDNVV